MFHCMLHFSKMDSIHMYIIGINLRLMKRLFAHMKVIVCIHMQIFMYVYTCMHVYLNILECIIMYVYMYH